MSPTLPILDFRSDTVTRPGAAMRRAMAEAEVGDDVFEEDPTVNRLEDRVAELFGREKALFVPSGTMANLIAIAVHCRRGEEALLERRTHSFVHEAAGAAALFGIQLTPLDNPEGMLGPAQVLSAIRPDDIHEPRTRLLVIENTANLAGGRVVPLARMQQLRRIARERGLALHLDGARIWNASVASGTPLSAYAAETDSLMCCLSKGLGCPVGSLIVGERDFIAAARRLRKMLGGGMRQAGVLAACGLYALDHHVERLSLDHAVAAELAQELRRVLDGRHRVQEPETNILLVHTDSVTTTAETLRRFEQAGLLALALSDTIIRLVTHLDLPRDAAREAGRRLGAAAER
jgi:threonine aldolase